MDKIINIIKRPSGKTGWKIKGNNKTFSNKKLIEILKNNLLLENDCFIKFKNLGENGILGINWKIKELIENKIFTLVEAIEFLEAREQGKKIDITININYI